MKGSSEMDCPFHVDGIPDAPCICDGVLDDMGARVIVRAEPDAGDVDTYCGAELGETREGECECPKCLRRVGDVEALAEAVWDAMPAHHVGWRGLKGDQRTFYLGIAERLLPYVTAAHREAWDEGYVAGHNDYELPSGSLITPNPYRAGIL